MRLTSKHIDIIMKVSLMGSEIPKNKLFSKEEQKDIALLIENNYLEIVKSAKKEWLVNKRSAITNYYADFKKMISTLNVNL